MDFWPALDYDLDMTWERCDYSPFYRTQDPRSPLHITFLDPIDLIRVGSTVRKKADFNKKVEVLRNQVRYVEPHEINRVLREPQAFLMQSWINHILKAKRPGKDWIPGLLSDLDVDVVERDHLLDALDEYIANYSARLSYAQIHEIRIVRSNLEDIRQAFHELGILPSCA